MEKNKWGEIEALRPTSVRILISLALVNRCNIFPTTPDDIAVINYFIQSMIHSPFSFEVYFYY